jgi:hypothetical protein
MSKITIAGNAVVITSSMKLEDLKTIKKYRPEALVLKGGEDGKEPIFVVSVTDDGYGSINKYGATFASETHDEAKLATITMAGEFADETNICEAVADAFGSAKSNLDKIEATLSEVLEEIVADKKAVMESITVVQ